GMRLAVAAAAVCAVIDILHQFAHLEMAGQMLSYLPLGTSGLGWIVPVCAAIAMSFVLPQKVTGKVEKSSLMFDVK
ncbi:MAG: branched-chain amino acid transport system II carrier protein, partial [Caecibacter massiliensis]|nr:branched-chain amino acid transport system II carrier protein [Caecibacter massiliensis]